MIWINHTDRNKIPHRHRLLLVYCPDWNDSGYAVVVWTGYRFECEGSSELTDYVLRWQLIFEAD